MRSRSFAGAIARGALLVGAPLLASCASLPVTQAREAPIAAVAPEQGAFDVALERVVSPGGIEAWLASDSTVPIIVVNAYWPRGAASDAPAQFGLTNVMSDMLTEGAGELDANAFKERLETLNMSLGFSGGWDGVSMGLTTLTENRDAAFAMARTALMAPRFDEAPLARIKRQALVAIAQRETSPNFIANRALNEALIAEHAYARITTREGVSRIDRAALAGRHRAVFGRDGLVVTVAGDIDAATLGRLLDETFGALPAGAPDPATPDAQIAPAQALVVRALPQPQSVILFAAPGVDVDDPDWIALAVANYIVGGGGFSSRLMDEVREKRGLVYGVGTGPSVLDHLALIRGRAQTENQDVREAIEVIRAELERFYRDGATQKEVDDAITYLTGSFALDLDSNAKIAGVAHAYHTDGRAIDYINRRNGLIRAITREDVNRVARRLFNPDAFTFVVVGEPEGLSGAGEQAQR